MSDFDDLLKLVMRLAHTLEEVQHTHANALRVGTVQKADGKKGYQVDFGKDGDGKPIPSAWFPHPEQGGAFKTWRPMDEGQIVYVIAPGGDQRQAFIIPKGGFSDKNPQPSEKLDENVETYGKVRTTWKKDGTEKKVGDKVTVTTTTGAHTAVADNSTHRVEAGTITNDTPQMVATRDVHLATG